MVALRSADIPFAVLLEPQVNKRGAIRRGEGTKVVAEQANYQAILLVSSVRPARVGTSICCSPSPAPTAFRIRIRLPRWNILSSPVGGRG